MPKTDRNSWLMNDWQYILLCVIRQIKKQIEEIFAASVMTRLFHARFSVHFENRLVCVPINTKKTKHI